MDERQLTVEVKDIIPSLTVPRSKGANGIVAVVGGDGAYIGATYFTGIAALKVGADMVYVFTSKEGENVKLLSPDYIVHQILDDANFMEISKLWMSKVDVVVIGPGFSREADYYQRFVDLTNECRFSKKGLVLDSSALYQLSKNLDVIKDYPEPGVILTPNKKEFNLLFGEAHDADYTADVKKLGKTITVLRKGVIDEVINFEKTVKLPKGGSNRRGTGQGDFLAGVVGAFLAFSIKNKLNKTVNKADVAIVVCEGASKLVRKCNYSAFVKKGRAMLTSDMVEEISEVFKELFEVA